MLSIDKLPALPTFPNTGLTPSLPQAGPSGVNSFGDTLKQFIGDVNQMQVAADVKTQKFATGEIKDSHEVMAASEEAGISLQLLIEVRNKALDAYRELMRISV
jgi:flagellar hook-basal body complex protein FliE